MTSKGSYQKTPPPIDMRPARYFQSLTTAQIIDQFQWSGEIIADDVRTGHRSMIELPCGGQIMPIKIYVKSLRFQLHRREYQGAK